MSSGSSHSVARPAQYTSSRSPGSSLLTASIKSPEPSEDTPAARSARVNAMNPAIGSLTAWGMALKYPESSPGPSAPDRCLHDICTAHRLSWTPIPDPGHRDPVRARSEEHTSELQSRFDLVCRLLLEKKKDIQDNYIHC